MVQVVNRVAEAYRRADARREASVSVWGIGGHVADTLFGHASTRLKEEADRLSPRVLFVQTTNPGAYPPLIHASLLMAEAGWEVTFLSAPITGNWLAMPSHPRVTVRAVRV